MTQPSTALTITGLLVLVSGCHALEPYERHGSWHPTGTYDANIAIMAADPADLVRGRGATASDGHAAAVAIERLRHDHVKPLADGNSISNAAPSAAAGLTGN